MSDILELHADVTDAAAKRYDETISIGENEYDIVFRQATDKEKPAFHSVVDEEERKEWKQAHEQQQDTEMDESDLKRLKELQLKANNGRLSDEQKEELEQLQDNTEGIQKLLRMIAKNRDSVEAIQEIACTVVEPDDADIQDVLETTPDVQQEQWGSYATNEADAYELLKETILPELVYQSTDYSSVALGLQGMFIGQTAGHDPN